MSSSIIDFRKDSRQHYYILLPGGSWDGAPGKQLYVLINCIVLSHSQWQPLLSFFACGGTNGVRFLFPCGATLLFFFSMCFRGLSLWRRCLELSLHGHESKRRRKAREKGPRKTVEDHLFFSNVDEAGVIEHDLINIQLSASMPYTIQTACGSVFLVLSLKSFRQKVSCSRKKLGSSCRFVSPN